jgi:hypothetical protein
LTAVRIPIAEIEEMLRTKHLLPPVLADVRIDGESLVFYFSGDPESVEAVSTASSTGIHRRRRLRRKRNRMKTRGWEIVARIVNSKGQQCSIYKPFVDALREPNLSVENQKAVVERILRSNGNKPSTESIQYFLGNTLEYLKKNSSGNAQSPGLDNVR